MRQRRKITTDKLYEVYFVFLKPTTKEKFKRSKVYKDVVKLIEQNDYRLNNEYYQSFFEPDEDDPDDYHLEPDFYRFNFLVKKHATEVAKAFKADNKVYKIEQLVLDTEGECWWTWPEVEDRNPWLPEGCDNFDDCYEIYGDIPGDRG